MKIELVDAIPDMVEQYEDAVKLFIKVGLITLDEWNSKFKNYRDNCGYSMIHYLQSSIADQDIDHFITENPIMIRNREELEERFGVKIRNIQEMLAEVKKNEN